MHKESYNEEDFRKWIQVTKELENELLSFAVLLALKQGGADLDEVPTIAEIDTILRRICPDLPEFHDYNDQLLDIQEIFVQKRNLPK